MAPARRFAANHSGEAELLNEISELAEALTPVAARAGAAILALYRQPIGIGTKPDASPVTEADRRAEAIILDALARLDPDTQVIAEESSAENGLSACAADRFYLVDPLDGTKEFIRALDDFTVNIALIERGLPRFGLVYAPARAALFVTRGDGVAVEMELDAHAAPAGLPAARRLRVRKANPDALVAVASRSHNNPETERFLATLPIADTIQAGSSLKFAMIARGAADVYPRLAPTMEWDTAAGHAVLAAAGGRVELEDGTPLAYGKTDYLNPGFVAWGRAG
jgi:3'(2'), 5'-bisphosphate nucleotidase